jgi:hypothetical protein
VALLALAAVLLFGVTWAKFSRYNVSSAPSPHFSASVKAARVPVMTSTDNDPQVLLQAGTILPEPDWNGFVPLAGEVETVGAPPLVFQALRAPPVHL